MPPHTFGCSMPSFPKHAMSFSGPMTSHIRRLTDSHDREYMNPTAGPSKHAISCTVLLI